MLYLSRTFNLYPIVGDEGVATLSAWRISNGQIPYRDFFEIIPPFSFLPTALLFAFFGPSVAAERLLAVVYGLLLIVAVIRLLRQLDVKEWRQAAAAAILIPCGTAFWPIPSHHWVVDILQLFGISAIIEAGRGHKPALNAIMAGVLCALACFTLQDQGAYLVLALPCLSLLWIPERKLRWRVLGSWMLGGIVVAAAFAMYLLPLVSIGTLWNDWIAFPLHHYNNHDIQASGFFSGWEKVLVNYDPRIFKTLPLYTLSLTVLLAIVSMMPFISLAGSFSIWHYKRIERWELGALFSGWLAFLGACGHRWAVTNLLWALPILLVLALKSADDIFAHSHNKSILKRAIVVLAGIAVLSAVTYASIMFRYAAPEYNAPVRGAAGTLRWNNYAQAAQLAGAIGAVERFTPPGSPMIMNGFACLPNFLTLHPNPTRYNFLYYPYYNTVEQEKEVISLLDKRPEVSVLLTRPPDSKEIFEGYIIKNYACVWNNGAYFLFLRKPDYVH